MSEVQAESAQLCRFGVSMDARLLTAFDGLLTRKGYTNRSEALRDLVRQAMVDDATADADTEVVGAISLVYDRRQRRLADDLREAQASTPVTILCTTCVPVDDALSLECIVCRGLAQEVRRLGDHCLGLRGVKHGDLLMTTATALS